MSGEASIDLQTAIYRILSTDVILAEFVTGVFDSVPDSQAFPFVTMGDITMKDWSTDTYNGEDYTFLIHSWSRDLGKKTVLTIMKRIYALFHKGSLTLSSGNLILSLCEFQNTFLDPDGVTYHGVQRFRMLVQEG